MQSEPRGPVYLMMQRETLTQHWNADEIRRYPTDQFAATSGGGADPKLIDGLADKLLTAENPILITGYAGRSAQAAQAIDALAQFAGIAVYEANMTNNISHDSPCFVGFTADKAVPQADVGLLVDVDVPWFPSDAQAKPNSFWAHIDIDTLKPGSPMWTFPGNLRMQGDSGRILQQVLEAVKAKATPRLKDAAAARLTRIKALRDERIARAAKLAADKGRPGAINPHYLMAELGKLLADDDIIFNEGVTNAGAVLMQIPRRVPNTTMRSGGGGLGWSGGMALGAKLAAPERLMVQISGDGGFYFGNPSSVFAVAQQYKLPILSIVMDNSGWNAVKQSTLRVFPEGEAKTANEFEAELAPKVAFSKVGEAFDAHAEELSDPAEVAAALARCVKEVRNGRAALLHARVTKM
jgi:acetolactate synthase-1/2/3 large subunit